jgi:hypothetical protein
VWGSNNEPSLLDPERTLVARPIKRIAGAKPPPGMVYGKSGWRGFEALCSTV